MLAPALKAKIDGLWDKFWAGGLANPLVAIDQIVDLIDGDQWVRESSGPELVPEPVDLGLQGRGEHQLSSNWAASAKRSLISSPENCPSGCAAIRMNGSWKRSPGSI